MKRVILVSFLLMCTSLVYAQNSNLRNINVKAEVEVTAKADRAVFSFTVNGTGPTLRMAVDDAKKRVGSITDGLMQIGLTTKNFSTSYFHSGEEKSKTAFIFSKEGYKTSITVTVNVDSLALLEEAILYLSDAKPDKFSGINFVLHDYEQIKIDALEKAITKAKQKADLIAKIMGAELGELIYFNEYSRDNSQHNARISSSNAGYDLTDFNSGGGSVFFSPDRKIITSVEAVIAVKKPL